MAKQRETTRKTSPYSFSLRTAFDGPEEARALIFKKGTQEIHSSVPFEEVPFSGTLREAGIGGIKKRQAEYVYEYGGRVVLDPEAELVLGRKPFGSTEIRDKYQLRCGFVKEHFDWGEQEAPPRIPYEEVISYYLHVRGFTMHPSSKVRHRGTFRGLEEKIPYLKELGVNQVVLMPAYEFEEAEQGRNAALIMSDDAALQMVESTGPRMAESSDPRRVNYWGYAPAWYFAPKAGYCAGKEPDVEFKSMVRAMHAAGLEVVMEFAFRDEVPADRCLRALIWWAQEYHVDGFLLLERPEVAQMAAGCPLLRYTKLLYGYFEPGYVYPKGRRIPYRSLADCNDGFQTDCRRLLKGDADQLQMFVQRQRQNGSDVASVNYISGHDGFTLMDLVSYDKKHNEENGEQNRDGAETEYSWNCGVEGPTRKRAVNELRLRQMKNAFAMLLLSQGTPMIRAGDEIGNSQGGNSNPWCIDSEVTWINWNGSKSFRELRRFVQELIALRRQYSIFHRESTVEGRNQISCGYPDFSCHGERAWYGAFAYQNRHVGLMYCGVQDQKETFLYFAYNFHWDAQSFALPYLPEGMEWSVVLDTSGQTAMEECAGQEQIREFMLPGRTVRVLAGRQCAGRKGTKTADAKSSEKKRTGTAKRDGAGAKPADAAKRADTANQAEARPAEG